ncbi:DUF6934 family protein [Chitinophaga silvisoli]|uniref:Uncharacterized protein n=1 Tax=Chitinophaga silvisoli TaxID=2291814 RepID=A0A3E1NTS1_9BACT|nr:hypothetical protein [Chitinophaga silvisoli]RFM31310.1 hypothetical protein DXN04_29740 [Chitinophaga silvisoli]
MFGLDKYQYSTDKTFMAYHFISNGPNGAIQKIAKFNLIGEDLYNFGLGDLDAVTGDISDTVISDNKDVEVIMLRKTKKVMFNPRAIFCSLGKNAGSCQQ